MSILEGKHILLGVSGSIAAYKAAALASRLTQGGAQVTTILTRAAAQFVTPLTFQSVTGQKTYTDDALWGAEGHILHIGLAHQADLLAIVPATAQTLAKLAQGQADNLLTLSALAARCPVLAAPAMDAGMYEHPATQANVQTLQARGVYFAGPTEGRMASGLHGLGRMLEPDELLGHIRYVLGRSGALKGKRLLISAGGTQEPIDPVRVLTNKSSGRQGYALAQCALDMGADVHLVTTPTALTPPVGAAVTRVQTAAQMRDAILQACPGQDALIMAAAVADFTPAAPADHKLKKREGIPQIILKPAPDILSEVAALPERQRPAVVVGFAAESHDLLTNAAEKLHKKRLDLIVANDISATDAGFSVPTNRVTLLYPDGHQEALPLMDKFAVAAEVLSRVQGLLANQREN